MFQSEKGVAQFHMKNLHMWSITADILGCLCACWNNTGWRGMDISTASMKYQRHQQLSEGRQQALDIT